MRSDDLAFSFEIELNQISPENEKQDERQQEHDNLERNEQDVGDVGRRELRGLADEIIDDDEEDDEDDDEASDHARAFFLRVFDGWFLPEGFLNRVFISGSQKIFGKIIAVDFDV